VTSAWEALGRVVCRLSASPSLAVVQCSARVACCTHRIVLTNAPPPKGLWVTHGSQACTCVSIAIASCDHHYFLEAKVTSVGGSRRSVAKCVDHICRRKAVDDLKSKSTDNRNSLQCSVAHVWNAAIWAGPQGFKHEVRLPRRRLGTRHSVNRYGWPGSDAESCRTVSGKQIVPKPRGVGTCGCVQHGSFGSVATESVGDGLHLELQSKVKSDINGDVGWCKPASVGVAVNCMRDWVIKQCAFRDRSTIWWI